MGVVPKTILLVGLCPRVCHAAVYVRLIIGRLEQRIGKVNHVAYATADASKAVAFYHDILGLPVSDRLVLSACETIALGFLAARSPPPF